jgi:hypothetical protein
MEKKKKLYISLQDSKLIEEIKNKSLIFIKRNLNLFFFGNI